MNDYRKQRIEDAHEDAANVLTQVIDVDGVIVYPIEGGSFGIEVSIDTPDGPGIIEHYEAEDGDEMDEVAHELAAELDKLEDRGLDRNDQQLYVAGYLDHVVRVTA